MSGTFNDDPFTVAVSQWIDRAHGLARAALQATAQDALARVKELTPVKTGYLRSNWTVSDGSAVVTIQGDRAASSQEVIQRLQLGQPCTILNDLKYAARVEFGFVGTDKRGRHYNQPGVGMMQQTISEMPKIAAKATARIIAG